MHGRWSNAGFDAGILYVIIFIIRLFNLQPFYVSPPLLSCIFCFIYLDLIFTNIILYFCNQLSQSLCDLCVDHTKESVLAWFLPESLLLEVNVKFIRKITTEIQLKSIWWSCAISYKPSVFLLPFSSFVLILLLTKMNKIC